MLPFCPSKHFHNSTLPSFFFTYCFFSEPSIVLCIKINPVLKTYVVVNHFAEPLIAFAGLSSRVEEPLWIITEISLYLSSLVAGLITLVLWLSSYWITLSGYEGFSGLIVSAESVSKTGLQWSCLLSLHTENTSSPQSFSILNHSSSIRNFRSSVFMSLSMSSCVETRSSVNFLQTPYFF